MEQFLYRVELAICWYDGKWTRYWVSITEEDLPKVDREDAWTEADIWQSAREKLAGEPNISHVKAIGLISYTRLDYPQELLSSGENNG